MRQEGSLSKTWPVAADMSASQYECMVFSAPNSITVATGTGDTVVGILQNDDADAAGKGGLVCIGGVCKAKVGDTVTDGALLGPAADGALDPVTADEAVYCAIACDDGADGDIIDVIFVGHNTISTT